MQGDDDMLPNRCPTGATGSAGPRRGLLLTFLLAGFAASATPLAGQGVSTAGLRGRVFDQAGAPVEGALVTLEHPATGATSTALTTGDGRYHLPNQRPGGPYRVTVARIGFADFTRDGLQLLLGQYADLDVELLPRAIEVQGLVVEVEQDLEFNRGRIGISTLVTSDELDELPTLTRNFVDFAVLSPLVRVSREGTSVLGTNYRFNSLSVDGALNQDVFGLSTNNQAGGRAGSRVIPLEAVEQFQVLVAPFDVRQSGFTGGALNAVTKSGTNEFRSSAFGYYRGDALVGDLVIDDVATMPELSTAHGGFTVSGPIERDRAHFFVAGEWERVREPPSGFHIGESDPFRLSLVPDSVARMRSLLQSFGADPGTASSFQLENTVANLFARLDWQIGGRHDAMLRYSFSAADDDSDPNRLPGDAYEFSSNGSEVRSRSHSAVFQIFSSLGNRLSNEFAANVQFLEDNEKGRAGFPQVTVGVDGVVDGLFVTRDVRGGADFFGQENGLDQRVIQLANNLGYHVGRHQFLFGASGTWFNFDRRFVPGALGSYRFDTLEDLELNRPDRYEITIPLTRGGSNPTFRVRELALYAQDEWAAHDRLTLRAGARLDVPTFSDGPGHNRELQSELGIDTSRLPGEGGTISLRAGLNWRPFEGTQVRAGIGLFTGRPAFSWLANAFQNNGLATTTLVCRGMLAPAFAPSQPAPTACAGGFPAGGSAPIINYFDPDFAFPQDMRTMFAVDQRLPGGLLLSASWITNLARRQIFISNDNLLPAVSGGGPEEGFTHGYGFAVRRVWGEPLLFGNEQLWEGGRISERFGPVLRIGNRRGNYSYAATIELKKDFGQVLGLRAGYSLTRSADFQDLISLDVTSNYATTPINLNPNDPVRQRSRFDRPHKVVASAHARLWPRFGGTGVSVLYVSQSGVPYSYVYEGDVNGDGFPGPRASTLSNDLIYIPERLSDFPGSIVSQIMWTTLLEVEECLREQLMRILARNTCETPWSHRIDVRVSQNVAGLGLSGEITLDVLNVLNLLDSSWGHVQIANPVVQLFRVRRQPVQAFVPGSGGTELVAYYTGAIRRDRTTGRVSAARPFALEVPTSQWRAQLGMRVRLGS